MIGIILKAFDLSVVVKIDVILSWKDGFNICEKKNLRIAMIRVMARVSFGSKYSSNGIKHTKTEKKGCFFILKWSVDGQYTWEMGE